jgi:ribosomal RNA-processing protein 17
VEEVNAMLRPAAASDDEETDGEEGEGSREDESGMLPAELPAVDHEAEYIDEEKYTTVTVETMDISKEGLFKAQQGRDDQDLDDGGKVALKTDANSTDKRKHRRTKEAPKDGVQKRKKKRNFRYEGKTDRKEARTKQKSKNSRQARQRRAAG